MDPIQDTLYRNMLPDLAAIEVLVMEGTSGFFAQAYPGSKKTFAAQSLAILAATKARLRTAALGVDFTSGTPRNFYGAPPDVWEMVEEFSDAFANEHLTVKDIAEFKPMRLVIEPHPHWGAEVLTGEQQMPYLDSNLLANAQKFGVTMNPNLTAGNLIDGTYPTVIGAVHLILDLLVDRHREAKEEPSAAMVEAMLQIISLMALTKGLIYTWGNGKVSAFFEWCAEQIVKEMFETILN